MGKKNRTPTTGTRPVVGERTHDDELADEAGRDVVLPHAGVDETLTGLGDFDGGEDALIPLEESELELEPASDEEELEGVAHIRALPPDDPPRPVFVRWIVPPTSGPTFAHAMLTDSKRTLCYGHRVEGAVYPPHVDLPRCTVCVDTLESLRKAAANGE